MCVMDYEINKKLYVALMSGGEEKVMSVCREIPEGPLRLLTIHNDTVLQMATYSQQEKLVLNLLKLLSPNQFPKLKHQNDAGNTVLHEAAISEKLISVASELLRIQPALLFIRNKHGETPLFCAARYGKSKMFQMLDEEINAKVHSEEILKSIHARDDKTTILHISILSENFELALSIAKKYGYLVGKSDGDGMTGLQLLACNSSAFKSGNKQTHLKRLLYPCISIEDTTATEEPCWSLPLLKSIRTEKRGHKSAEQLANYLIERAFSWEHTESVINKGKLKTHTYGKISTAETPQDQGIGEGKNGRRIDDLGTVVKPAETPLFLATKRGCTEIVEEILKRYPQAVEHVDDEGSNILLVAIKYRQIKIFNIVEKMKFPMRRLLRKIDNEGNSILHVVGLKPQHRHADMRSPALLLREDLLLFERVKKIFKTHFMKIYNSKGKTAEELFAKNQTHLYMQSRDWLKRTAENCSIVSVLIATVAFAAAYTVPGGLNQNTGYPLLLDQPFFFIFIVADALSLAFALTSLTRFLSILTSSFQLNDFKQSLHLKLILGLTFLISSVSMMMLAFAATVILTIRNNQQWTKIALYAVTCLPVISFLLSYSPLYKPLKKTFEYQLKKIGEVFPRCNSVRHRSWISNPFNFRKSQSSVSSNHAQSPHTIRCPI